MTKKRSSDPAMRELERELQANTQALKDAYLRFDYVCDNDLVESCIFEINALKARSNYLLRQIKQRSGQPVPSGIPQAVAVPVQEAPCVAAGAMKGGRTMSVVKIAALSLTVLFLLVAVVRLFHRPLRLALRVVFNSALGLLALWILERTAPVTGLTLGVNWFNALTVGVLGVPGLGLLLLVKWVLV